MSQESLPDGSGLATSGRDIPHDALHNLIAERNSLSALNDLLENALRSNDGLARSQAIQWVRSAHAEALRSVSSEERLLNPEYQRLQILADGTLSKSDQALGAVAGFKDVALETVEGVWTTLQAANTLLNASFGDQQAQHQVLTAGKTMLTLAHPDVLRKAFDTALDQQREKIASAYENGNAYELGKLGLESLSNLPLPGPTALGVIKKVENAADAAVDLAKVGAGERSANTLAENAATVPDTGLYGWEASKQGTFGHRTEGIKELKSAIVKWVQSYADQLLPVPRDVKVMAMKPVALPPVSDEAAARIAAAYAAQQAEGRRIFDVMHEINPGWAIDETRQINCFNCALATAATQYGHPTSALPVTFGLGMRKGEMGRYFQVDTKAGLDYVELLDEMLKLPDSSIGFIDSRDSSGAHIFNVAKDNGKVFVEDHQTVPPLKIAYTSETRVDIMAQLNFQLDSRGQGLPATPFSGLMDDVDFTLAILDHSNDVRPDRITKNQMETTRDSLRAYQSDKPPAEAASRQTGHGDVATLAAPENKAPQEEKPKMASMVPVLQGDPVVRSASHDPLLIQAMRVLDEVDKRAVASGKSMEQRFELAVQARDRIAQDINAGTFPEMRSEVGVHGPDFSQPSGQER